METSQSVIRVITLVGFTLMFATMWANDRPSEMMARKDPPPSEAVLTQETHGLVHESEQVSEGLTNSMQVMTLELDEISIESTEMVLSIDIETEGLTLTDEASQAHLRNLPLGIADGDYMMVDPQGGVGWVRVRGQQQVDSNETLLTTKIGDAEVRYIRVTPTTIASEAVRTIR